MVAGLLTTYKDYPINILNYKFSDSEIKSIMNSYDFSAEQSIWDQYNQSIHQAVNSGESEKIAELIEERDSKLIQLEKRNNLTIDEAKKEIIKEKNSQYDELKNNIQMGADDIKYYFTDNSTKAVYSNIGSEINISAYIKKNALYTLKFPSTYNSYTFKSISSMFYNSGMEGYFIIPKNIGNYSTIISDYNYYNSIRKRLKEEIWLLAISVIILGILSVFIYKNRNNEDTIIKLYTKYKKIPLDLRIVLFIIILLISISYMKSANFFSLPINARQIFTIMLSSIYSLYIIIVFFDAVRYIHKPENIVYDLRNSLCGRFKSSFKDCLLYKGVIIKTVVIMIITIITGILMNIVMESFQYNSGIELLFLIIVSGLYLMTVFSYVIFKLGYLSKIIKGTSQMISGDLGYTIEERKGGMLSLLTHNINNMELGYRKTLEDKVKSERLKSELITNVSHDLKTPLTSIINYINFLKNDDITEEDKKSYLEVLDRKSQRLKILIEDLFEASKMASGSVQLEFQQVNLIELLKQALGEYDEKIKNSSLTFKVNGENQNILLNLDGKKTWRVFDNLINNALKYSQPDTRVYIDIIDTETKASVIIKNISAYELDFDPQEIFERFKRGDKSRNTEGSGLGLDIAKSIVELEGGTLRIEIDGDLFKAIVEFNKKI